MYLFQFSSISYKDMLNTFVSSSLYMDVARVNSHPFKTYQNCCVYWSEYPHGQRCKKCEVYVFKINECLTFKHIGNSRCAIECSQCQYFYEHHIQYTSLIHRIPVPAVILKDLYLRSGNKSCSDICGLEIN